MIYRIGILFHDFIIRHQIKTVDFRNSVVISKSIVFGKNLSIKIIQNSEAVITEIKGAKLLLCASDFIKPGRKKLKLLYFVKS